jgi:hypothetical protein
MNVTCPSCGAEMDLDVLLAHEDSRQALAQLAALSLPLGKRVLQYLRLFKPATRQMSHSRVVKLIEELLPDLQRGAIRHNGRDWQADLATWSDAFDRVLERRDNGKLTLPLKSHGYLFEVIAGLADKAEGAAEGAAEAERRGERRTGTGRDLQPADGALSPVSPALVPPPNEPSAYARRVKAEIEARRRARKAGEAAPGVDE